MEWSDMGHTSTTRHAHNVQDKRIEDLVRWISRILRRIREQVRQGGERASFDWRSWHVYMKQRYQVLLSTFLREAKRGGATACNKVILVYDHGGCLTSRSGLVSTLRGLHEKRVRKSVQRDLIMGR